MNVDLETFSRLDIRAGVILRAEYFTRARKPAYKVWVDFGSNLGIKATSAQITVHYNVDDLPGKKVLGLTNVEPRNIAGFQSQFLLLGLSDVNGDIVLSSYENGAVLGSKIH